MDLMVDHVKHETSNAFEDGESEVVQNLHKVETDLRNEMYVYREDVVMCIHEKDMLGVVLEVPGDSDSECSDADDSDIEDGDNENTVDNEHVNEGNVDSDAGDGDCSDKTTLSDGEVRVTWLNGIETTNNLRDLVVVDRSFLHGDLVASAANPSGQLGLVVDVHIIVELRSPAGRTIKDVSSLELKRIRKFTIGDYVVHGPWLGRVEDVLDNVTVLFDDGSSCKVLKADPLRLKPVSKCIADDPSFPYYPGQRVKASSSAVYKNCRFLSGSWKANCLEGTVTKVEAGSVLVYWISSSSLGTGDNAATVPPEQQNPKKLTLVSCFIHSNWQLGDPCLFSPPPLAPSSGNSTEMGDCMMRKCDMIDNHLNCGMAGLGQNKDVTDNTANERVCNLCIHDQEIEPNVEVAIDLSEQYEVVENQSSSTQDHLGSHAVLDSGTNSLAEERTYQTEMGNFVSCQKDLIRENRIVNRKKLRKLVVKREHKGNRKDSFEKAFLIVNIDTKVDVIWQDGTRQSCLDSTSLVPISTPGDQDFFPEQYVVEKSSHESEDSSETKRVGVVRSVNSIERTASVRWLKPFERPEDLRQFDIDEIVSVYELDQHPDYDYCYGETVIRLAPVAISDENSPSGCSVDEGKKETVVDLSWVGHIIGLQDGDIEVAWADGMISKVGPQAIFVVGRDDDDAFEGGSEDSNGASWETVEENDMDALAIAEEGSVVMPRTDDTIENGHKFSKEDVATNGPFSSAFSFVARMASGIFSRGKSQVKVLESENEENVGLHDLAAAACSVEPGNSNSESSGFLIDEHGSGLCNDYRLGSETIGDEIMTSNKFHSHDLDDSSVGKCIEANGHGFSFKHFDIAKDPSDHHFAGGQIIGERNWAKKVQQEWNILRKNLPDAIYVRVFEDRMDLLQAAIIGASGTPYQDGLFFFDFQLPPEYPFGPPKAYYHSGGLRINPNLYEDGTVCLSLLNTWTGKGNEVWDSSSSSILQVLVSIQGLVLNSKPYFNEAGYEKQIGTIEGEKNSLPYNENAFLLNLKSMMYVLRRPPLHFEEFSKAHFRRRGWYILKSCDAYMKGSVVGSLTKDADLTKESNKYSCSAGFRLMLAKILPRLFAALKEVGAECSEFQHLVES